MQPMLATSSYSSEDLGCPHIAARLRPRRTWMILWSSFFHDLRLVYHHLEHCPKPSPQRQTYWGTSRSKGSKSIINSGTQWRDSSDLTLQCTCSSFLHRVCMGHYWHTVYCPNLSHLAVALSPPP